MRIGLLTRLFFWSIARPGRSFLGLLAFAAIATALLSYPASSPSSGLGTEVCARDQTSLGRLMAAASLGGSVASAQASESEAKGRKGKEKPLTGCPSAGDPDSIPAAPPDLVIDSACTVAGGPGGANNATHYFYGNINIVSGGSLTFNDAQIDFWAKSIIVESGGSLLLGSSRIPIGTAGKGPLNTARGVVTINLWGPEGSRTNGEGVPCFQKHCGIPDDAWDNGRTKTNTQTNGVTDFFYQYDTLTFDGANPDAYFGYKVIGLGFGGTLQMFGAKGSTMEATAIPENHLFSGTSWLRLSRNAAINDDTIYVQGDVSRTWEKGDEIVLTSTDYLPGHSEKLIVSSVTFLSGSGETQINLDTTNGTAVQYAHNGTAIDLTNSPLPTAGLRLTSRPS